MRKLMLIVMAAVLAAPLAAHPAGTMTSSVAQLPLSFEPNRGQAAAAVQFLTRGNGYALWLTPDEAVLSLARGDLRIKFVGADGAAHLAGEGLLPAKSSYFLSADPAGWRTDIPHYERVIYRNLYPGVSLAFYGNPRQLECDFMVAPGADPRLIRLAFQGGSKMHIDPRGDLVLRVAGEEVRLRRPHIYQTANGARKDISGGYVWGPGSQIGFRLARYDVKSPLVIDPVVQASSYIGGNNFDAVSGVALDAQQNFYATGQTSAPTFPGAGPRPQSATGFVLKLDPTLSKVIYSVYLSGTGRSIAVDAQGNAYVTGVTTLSNFPVSAGAHQSPNRGGADAFVVKLNAAGSAMLYSAVYGGSAMDSPSRIAVDAQGNAYVAGTTTSTNLPITGGFQRSYQGGLDDGFLCKLSPAGALLYGTYVGGAGREEVYGLAIDSSGNAYMAGATDSQNFPVTAGAFLTKLPGTLNNAFRQILSGWVAKLDSAGAKLTWCTYLGGTGFDTAMAVDVDAAGNVYVGGGSTSTDFPTTRGVFKSANTGAAENIFVAKFQPGGDKLAYATYYGGSGEAFDQAYDLKVGSFGTVYITGQIGPQSVTGGPELINPDPVAFLAVVNPDASKISPLQLTKVRGVGRSLAVQTTPNPPPKGNLRQAGEGSAGNDAVAIGGSVAGPNLSSPPASGTGVGSAPAVNAETGFGQKVGNTVDVPMLSPPTIVKSASKTAVKIGEVFTYTITVTNPNSLPMLVDVFDVLPQGVMAAVKESGTILEDKLFPPEATFSPPAEFDGCVYLSRFKDDDPTTLEYSKADIAPFPGSMTITMRVIRTIAGITQNQATVGWQFGGDVLSNIVTVRVGSVDLLVTKNLVDDQNNVLPRDQTPTFQVGQTFAFGLRVRNVGDGDAINVALTDSIPDGLTILDDPRVVYPQAWDGDEFGCSLLFGPGGKQNVLKCGTTRMVKGNEVFVFVDVRQDFPGNGSNMATATWRDPILETDKSTDSESVIWTVQ